MICSWAPRALANRHRVGRREARARDMPRLPASHAPLAAASFAGAVFGWRRRNAFDLHAISCQAWLLALHRGGREKSSLINPPYCLDHLAHMGTREHTVPREFGNYLSDISAGMWFWAKPTRLRVERLCADPRTTHISSITLKYRLNLSIDCELFTIYSHRHLPQGEPGSVGPTRNLFHDPTRSASDICIALRR